MKKVLISGMTASQSSSAYSEKSATFIGSIADALSSRKVKVDWHVPSMDDKHVDAYDKVLVGVAPILSLAANRSFTALSTIERLWDTDKLILFIDAPEPSKIHASLRSVCKNPDSLTKSLYSRRPGYGAISSSAPHREKMLSIVETLTNSSWKKTLFPALPWSASDKVLRGLPENVASSCVPILIDSYLIGDVVASETHRYNQWVVDTESTKWVKNSAKNLIYPMVPAKTKRTQGDDGVIENIMSSIGVLIGPHDDKVLWWSNRFALAMNTMTPVATEWRESSLIGNSWSHLASGIEQLSIDDRYDLAAQQRSEYVSSIPCTEEMATTLLNELEI